MAKEIAVRNQVHIPVSTKVFYVWMTLVHVAAGVWVSDHLHVSQSGNSSVAAISCCKPTEQLSPHAQKVLAVFTPEEKESLEIANLTEGPRTVWNGYDKQLKREKGNRHGG